MNPAPEEKFASLRNGLLEFALLKIIARERVYAADILAALEDTPLKAQEGTLYPLLSKMRREEWVEYEWRESAAGPPRKYYSLTGKGRERLREADTYWQDIISAIKKLGK